ncbi:hypothetical protein SISNIDRAFT_469921 [Sistotremastrum niveocremeum HHB9708]|uniref:F-box domain-containing protein n=1 Tax=Sistotremastrum niveocremeum HHB9708 TaxID=1314777 RepID=A0A164PEA5_9AGAM|nr:hypothetical protein SISNIDRAFT_469921 [Sistotremastrum niveocremeum HHB9708]
MAWNEREREEETGSAGKRKAPYDYAKDSSGTICVPDFHALKETLRRVNDPQFKTSKFSLVILSMIKRPSAAGHRCFQVGVSYLPAISDPLRLNPTKADVEIIVSNPAPFSAPSKPSPRDQSASISAPTKIMLTQEIFHRIMWIHYLSSKEDQGTLPHRYQLQKDRQTRFYALRDFQVARLVCKDWNRWLLNDIVFWRHLCIQGEKSFASARDVLDRFPNHSFHIRVRANHAPESYFPVHQSGYDSCDEDDGDDEKDDGDEYGDVDEEYRSDEEDESEPVPTREKSQRFFGLWVEGAIELISSNLPRCEAISLRLPTQTLHRTLISWANVAAPGLRRFYIEATDYDGRTTLDLVMHGRPHNPMNPPSGPLLPAPFLRQSPNLTSLTIMNCRIDIF